MTYNGDEYKNDVEKMDLVSEPVQIIIPTNIFDDKDPSLSDKSGGRCIQLASAHTQYGVAFIINILTKPREIVIN